MTPTVAFSPAPAVAADPLVQPAEAGTLGATVLRSLTRHLREGYSSGLPRTLLAAVLTLGLLPVITNVRRFRAFARFQRQQLWFLGEWLRLNVGGDDARRLVELANGTRWRPGPALVAIVIALATLAASLGTLWRDPAAVDALLAVAMGDRSTADLARYGSRPLVALVVWNVGLALAYGLHWVQVRLNAAAVTRFVDGLNVVLAGERLEPVAVPPVGTGAHPAWLVVGLVGVLCGAVWAAPMALAGGLHRRYISVWYPAVRSEIAERVRVIWRAQHPGTPVPPWGGERSVCGALRCGAVLPRDASFCPRCGTQTERVARDAA